MVSYNLFGMGTVTRYCPIYGLDDSRLKLHNSVSVVAIFVDFVIIIFLRIISSIILDLRTVEN